jgi:hypothetical protein
VYVCVALVYIASGCEHGQESAEAGRKKGRVGGLVGGKPMGGRERPPL